MDTSSFGNSKTIATKVGAADGQTGQGMPGVGGSPEGPKGGQAEGTFTGAADGQTGHGSAHVGKTPGPQGGAVIGTMGPATSGATHPNQ